MNEALLVDFGQRVTKVRKHLAVKKSEFAKKLKISLDKLDAIESGAVSPGFEFFYFITLACGVNPLYLLFGDKPFLLRKIPIDNLGIAQSNDSENAVEQLFWYMQRSKVVKFHMLEFFIKFKLEHKHAIIDDMDQQKNEDFGYIPVFRPSTEPKYIELPFAFTSDAEVTNERHDKDDKRHKHDRYDANDADDTDDENDDV